MARLSEVAPGAAFAVGLLCGYRGLLPGAEGLVGPALYLVLFLVGMELGSAEGLARRAGRTGILGVIMGLAVIAAGAAGGLLAGAIGGLSPRLSAASGAASGWYSLAGPLVSEADPYMGLLAALSNMLRESLTLALYPALSRLDRLAAVSIGGATTMDSTLPVIAGSGGPEAVGAALGQGILITMVLPVLLPLIIGA